MDLVMMHDDIPCFPSMEENCSELHVNLKIVEKVSGFFPRWWYLLFTTMNKHFFLMISSVEHNEI